MYRSNKMVIGYPILGCSALTNADEISGNAVLLKRGDCFFAEKAKNAQDAGAKLIIIYNDELGGFFKMAAPDDASGRLIRVPVVATTTRIGEKLVELIGRSIDRFEVRSVPRPTSAHQNIATFSSFGPTLDGRIKPDVVAPGDRITSAGITRNGQSCRTVTFSGTSMATPHVAGAAALIRQYFMDGFYPSGLKNTTSVMTPSGPLIKAVMLNGAQDMKGFTV